jgi:hypothetical protein
MSRQADFRNRRSSRSGSYRGSPPVARPFGPATRSNPSPGGAKKQRFDPTENLEEIRYGMFNFTLPKYVQDTDKVNDKHRYLTTTTKIIREHSAPWGTKVDCLESRFNAPMVKIQAELTLADMKTNFASICYTWQFQGCTNKDFDTMDFPATNAAFNQADFQNECAYVKLGVTINPGIADPSLATAPENKERESYLKLPKNYNATGVPSFHAAITRQLLANPTGLLRAFVNNGLALPLGFQNRSTLDTEAMNKWRIDVYHNTLFEKMAFLLIDAYVGQGAREDAPAELRKLRQLKTDQETGMTRLATLDEHAQEFRSILQKCDQVNLYGFKLPELFLDSLEDNLKQLVIDENITVPDTTGFSNVQQLSALQVLITDINRVNNRNAALVDNTLRSALALQTNARGRYNAFLVARPSSHLQDNEHSDDQSQDGMDNPYDANLRSYEMPLAGSASHRNDGFNPHDPPKTISADVTYSNFLEAIEQKEQNFYCFNSPANQALERASGTLYPIRCFGCANSKDTHKNKDCFHT